MIDGDEKGKTQGWVQALVVRIDGDTLDLEIPELPPVFDTRVDRWSINLA